MEIANLKKASSDISSYSHAVSSNSPTTQPASAVHHPHTVNNSKSAKLVHSNPVSSTRTTNDTDRKQNIVIYGIPECPKGTPRYDRFHMDDQSATKVISTILPTFTSLGINDCYRLGRYDDSKPRSRPILVKLNRASDVSQILAKKSMLYSSAFRVHPDLPPAERKALSLLLLERKDLITSNVDKKTIKIHNSCLYINDKLHASVSDGSLLRHPTLGDHSAELQDIAKGASTTSPSSSSTTVDGSIPKQ